MSTRTTSLLTRAGAPSDEPLPKRKRREAPVVEQGSMKGRRETFCPKRGREVAEPSLPPTLLVARAGKRVATPLVERGSMKGKLRTFHPKRGGEALRTVK